MSAEEFAVILRQARESLSKQVEAQAAFEGNPTSANMAKLREAFEAQADAFEELAWAFSEEPRTITPEGKLAAFLTIEAAALLPNWESREMMRPGPPLWPHIPKTEASE